MSTTVSGSAASSSSDFVILNGQEEPSAPIASSGSIPPPPSAIFNPPENQGQGHFHATTTFGFSQSGYEDVTAPTLDADTLEFVSTEDQTSGAAESGALGDAYTGSLDTERHERFGPRQRGGVTSRLLDRHGFGWLMEVDEDEDEQQKPLL